MAKTMALAELTDRVGGSLDDAVRTVERANGKASGLRLTVPADVAEGLVDTYERVQGILREENRARFELEAAYHEYEDAHQLARLRVGADAYNASYERVRRSEVAAVRAAYDAFTGVDALPGSPQAHATARDARDAALEKWDRKHPLLDFEAFRRKGANLR